jgi:hypothetical protein
MADYYRTELEQMYVQAVRMALDLAQKGENSLNKKDILSAQQYYKKSYDILKDSAVDSKKAKEQLEEILTKLVDLYSQTKEQIIAEIYKNELDQVRKKEKIR